MKTRRSLALCLCVCCAAVAEQNVAPQLLKNPTMALQQGTPAAWRFTDFRTGGSPTVSADAGRGGSSCIGVVAATQKQRGAWMQTIRLSGQRFLRVEGWYRTDKVRAASGKGAMIRMTYRKGRTFLGDHRFRLEPSAKWKSLRFADKVIEGADIVIVELFNFFAPGTVWFDDVTCTLGTAADWASKATDMLDKPPAGNQAGYAPANDEALTFTPPAFRWLPVRGVKKWRVQCSTDPKFPAGRTRSYESSLTIYTPHETFEPGTYYWRYGFNIEDTEVTAWSKVRRFTIAPNPMAYPRPTMDQVAALIPKTHPRVFLTPKLVEQIRGSDDPVVKEMMANALRASKRYIGGDLYPEPPRLPKDRSARRNKYQEIFRTMRPFTSGMERCAFAYAVTGDRAAGAEAKRRLMHFMTWDPQGSSGVFHNDEPAMDLAKRGPRSFDWIYDLLTEEERKTCVEHFRLRLGDINKLHRRMPFETSPFSSHPGRMVPFVVEGGIVFFHDTADAKGWLDYTLHLMWNTYPAWGSADGGWHEGPGYWGAYIGMMTRNVYGFGALGRRWSKKPFYQNTGYFGLYGVPPYAKQKPFGDGHEGGTGAGHGDILYSLAALHDNAYFRWYAAVWGRHFSYGPERFLAYRPDLAPKPPVDIPQARVFENIGLVGMHSNLADPTGSVQMLFKSDPYGSVSHNHASQNAFAVNAYGEALAISSGYYQQYGCPHHAQWTWETKAHNSITIDGKGQRKRSRASQGRIARFWEDGNITYAMGDATAAYEGRLKHFLRHIVFLRPNVFVVVDDLAATKPVSAEWWLHARSEMAINEGAASATIAQGDVRLATRFLHPASLTFHQTDQFPVAPHRKESRNQWHLTVTPTRESDAPSFVTVLEGFLSRQGSHGLKAKPIVSASVRGAEIRHAGACDMVGIRLANAKPGEVAVGSASTDASVLVVRSGREGRSPKSILVCDARSLKVGENLMLSADRPVSASIQYGPREARVIVGTDSTARVSIHMPRKFANPSTKQGTRVVSRTGETAELRVEAGRHVAVFPAVKEEPLLTATLHGPGLAESRPLSPTVGPHITAWSSRTDGVGGGLHDAEVAYWAPRGSRLILTAGRRRHDWVAPGGDATERFRWIVDSNFPLVLINEHGLDVRARVHSVRFLALKGTGKLVPATVREDARDMLKIEAEKFVSHSGPADSTRTGKYVCSGGLLYGVGDLVTRVEYAVRAPKAGAYSIIFKHASDQKQIAIGLQVNGKTPSRAAELFIFGRTGGWGYAKDQWRVKRLCDANGQAVPLQLSPGDNRITLIGHGGRMHLDRIALEPLP